MSQLSMTGSGVVVALIVAGLKLFGIEVGGEETAKFVESGATVISFVLMIWGQVRRPELIGGLVRRK